VLRQRSSGLDRQPKLAKASENALYRFPRGKRLHPKTCITPVSTLIALQGRSKIPLDASGRGEDDVTRRRLDLREAAEALDTSVDAVRKRIARGTLESEKADGKVYIWLDDGAPRSDTDTLISEMRGRIESLERQQELLERQLEQANERDRENRRLLAAALERIPPQLEAPSEPREAPETATVEGTEPHPGGAQEGAQRPWWRRVFGGDGP